MDTPILSSRITAVTVFTSGALVTRRAELSVLSGQPQRIRLTGLPLCLDDSSVRVRMTGGVAVALDLGIVLEVPAADVSLPPATDLSLAEARRREARLRQEVSMDDERIRRLEAIELPERPPAARGAPPLPSPTAARLALVDFQRAEVAVLQAQRSRRREEHRQALERLNVLVAEATQASNARQARDHQVRKTVVVTLSWSGTSAAGTLELEYLVPGAHWVPSYTIRLDRELTRASVTIQGSVVQRSGEDWSEVQLCLSTADALAWSDLPELSSLRIGRSQAPVRKSGWREPPRGAEQLYQDFDDAVRTLCPATPPLPPAARAALPEGSLDVVKAKKLSARARSEQRPGDDGGTGFGSADTDREDEVMASQSLAQLGAPPPASMSPSPARPAPAPSRAAMRISRGAPTGGSLHLADEAKERLSDASSETYQEPHSDSPVPSDHPADELLAYRSLYLAGAQAPQRGRLTAMTPAMAYLDVSLQARLTVGVRVEDLLAQAVEIADAPRQLALPARCQRPITPQFAFRYGALTAAAIPSDGAWHAVGLGEQAAPSVVEHVAVPREGREVFRVVQLTNPFPTPLLTGPADVYIGDEYLMTADVPLTVPSGTLALGLGVEQGITVARNTTYSEEATGILSGSLALHHGITITLANKLRIPVVVDVRERLPVATPGVDECRVKLGAVQPPWEDFRQESQHLEGGHRWKVALPPGATQTLSVAYTVSIPAKSEIAAGNRREA